MTTTTTNQRVRLPAAEPTTLKPVRPARRWGVVGLGLALIALASLTVFWLLSRAGDSIEVVALRTDLARGQEITATDLTIVQIPANTAGLATVPADTITDLDGTIAASDLHAGSLLTPSSTTSALTPPTGTSVVGIALTAAQRPTVSLHAGDTVRIVATPTAQGEVPIEAPPSTTATIVSTQASTNTDALIVNVSVTSKDAPTLAARAATGRVALVLDSLGE